MISSVRRLRSSLKAIRNTPLHPQWLLGGPEKTIEWIRGHARGRVLDIGCADRWIQPHLPKECDYIGLDYPVTGGVLYRARPDVFADASRLPLHDSSVDTVLLLEVLEHLRHPAHSLSEIARVLRPGGELLLTLPFLYPVHDAPHDYQRYTCHGLVREMQAAGFAVEDPMPTLGSIETAGLLANLVMGGVIGEAIQKHSLSIVLLPAVAVAVPVINLLCWLLGKLLPSWPAVTAGYRLRARRQ